MSFFVIFLYLPLLFLKFALAVGVGMHWCQYIGIMLSINFRKSRIQKGLNKQRSFKKVYFYLLYSYDNNYSMPKGNKFLSLYLIPIMFQLYHF